MLIDNLAARSGTIIKSRQWSISINSHFLSTTKSHQHPIPVNGQFPSTSNSRQQPLPDNDQFLSTDTSNQLPTPFNNHFPSFANSRLFLISVIWQFHPRPIPVNGHLPSTTKSSRRQQPSHINSQFPLFLNFHNQISVTSQFPVTTTSRQQSIPINIQFPSTANSRQQPLPVNPQFQSTTTSHHFCQFPPFTVPVIW